MNTLLSLFLLFLNHSLHQDVYYQITQFVYEHLEEMDNYSKMCIRDSHIHLYFSLEPFWLF